MWERESVDRRQVGEWSFELRGDEIADLVMRGRRVLRSIRAVVRDRDWQTAEWTIVGDELHDDALVVRLRTASPGIEMSAVLRITAHGDEFTVDFDAVAATAVHTNRTGLVVLHPPQVAGAALTVTRADGAVAASEFPRSISAHQPVQDIAALAWTDDGVAIDVLFEGDVFEMEDQRNWTDASFKTYSRPLGLPFPYLLAAGEHVVQTVRVRARELTGAVVETDADELVLRVAGIFPAVSVGASTAPEPAPARMGVVGSELLVELDLAAQNWPAALERAGQSGPPLDVRFVLTDDGTADTLAVAAAALSSHRVARVSAFWPTGPARHVSDAAAIALLRQALDAAGVSAPVVGGARSHFTELNREHHRLPSGLAGYVFSITPLFHSLDTEQAIESVAIQRLVARQAAQIAGGAPVHIGPISLRPHFNDVATTPPPLPPSTDLSVGYGPELLDADDPRQASAPLAAWTIASVAACAVPGVASLSYFEEWGGRGIRSSAGDELPVAEAIRALAGLSGSTLLSGESPDGLLWAVGAWDGDGTQTVLVANLDRVSRSLYVLTPHSRASLHLGPYEWTSVVVR